MRILCVCVLMPFVFLCSRLSAEPEALKSVEPAPGTIGFYLKKIKGRYVFRDGKMKPIHVPTIPGVIRTVGSRSYTLLKGTVSQVLGENRVVVTTKKSLPSGATRHTTQIVSLSDNNNVSIGQDIQVMAEEDGHYACVTAGGATNTVPAYKLLRTITFKEYRQVYEAEKKAGQPDKIVSFKRVPSPPQRPASYRDLLKQRQEQRNPRRTNTQQPRLSGDELKKRLQDYNMKVLRAKGELGPPLPIHLTPEQDKQLVEEGILPPRE